MELRAEAFVTAVIGVTAAIGLLALTLVPFDYGVVESAVLACCFVLLGFYHTVLDDAFSQS